MTHPNVTPIHGWILSNRYFPESTLRRLGLDYDAGPNARWNEYLTQGHFAWLALRESPDVRPVDKR